MGEQPARIMHHREINFTNNQFAYTHTRFTLRAGDNF
jgi:hypothetical protein